MKRATSWNILWQQQGTSGPDLRDLISHNRGRSVFPLSKVLSNVDFHLIIARESVVYQFIFVKVALLTESNVVLIIFMRIA